MIDKNQAQQMHALKSERPDKLLTVREATHEQMFDELAHRIGVVTDATDESVVVIKIKGGDGISMIHGKTVDVMQTFISVMRDRTSEQKEMRMLLALKLMMP